MEISRRKFLSRSALIGCSVAASPLLTPISFAAAPWDNRLVVIILRGGLDGLDVVQPYGDPAWPGLRKKLAGNPDTGSLDLDGFFALHPVLAPLMPLWNAGELGFMHAVSTPYRDKRSHFDGQDLLEAGTMRLDGSVQSGWLNRMIDHGPGTLAEHAYALGRGDMVVLKGAAPVSNWAPDVDLNLSPQAQELMGLIMAEDPVFAAAFAEAERLSADNSVEKRAGKGHIRLATFAAKRLRQEARVTAFSLNGWDTHRNQARSIRPALTRLSDVLLTLKDELTEPVWNKTAVIAMTEFGRTVRENGTGGTDHGTGGMTLFAGGAIKGGRIYGEWPGLQGSALYKGRDLMPTADVRSPAAWIMRGLTGMNTDVLESAVFPGLDMGNDPGILR